MVRPLKIERFEELNYKNSLAFMKFLFLEPTYYTRYLPLNLLKLEKLEILHLNEVALVRGLNDTVNFASDKIYITSLFIYSWKPVHETDEFYHK